MRQHFAQKARDAFDDFVEPDEAADTDVEEITPVDELTEEAFDETA